MEELLSDPKLCIKCGKLDPSTTKDCTVALTRNAMKANQELEEQEDESGNRNFTALAIAQKMAGIAHAHNGSFRKAEICFIEMQRCLTEELEASHPRVAEAKD
jgi:hypothetical protein